MSSPGLRTALASLRATLLAITVPWGTACTDEPATHPPADAGSDAPEGTGCAAGDVVSDGGACRAPGPLGPCKPGELPTGNGCLAAGVTACGAGFEPDGAQGCRAILPAEPCGPGLMALPGETTCHEIAPCGEAPWGAIPIDASTQFVDASYAGADSDGTQQKPWTTVQAGVDAATDAGIVAVGAGSYAEDVVVTAKSVRLWGRCPSLVTVTGTSADGAAITVDAAAPGTELHGLGVSGAGRGISIRSSEGTLVDHVWVHDAAKHAVVVWDETAPASASITASLMEGTTQAGVFAYGANVAIDGIEVRGKPGAQDSRGVELSYDLTTQRRAVVSLRSSVVTRGAWAAVYVTGSDLTMQGTLVRALEDPAPAGIGPAIGLLVNADDMDTAQRGEATVDTSVIETAGAGCVYVDGSDLTMESTTVRDCRGYPSDQTHGEGIAVRNTAVEPTERPAVVIRSSLVERARMFGVIGGGADLTLEAVVVRDIDAQLSDGSFGRGVESELDVSTGELGALSLRGSDIARTMELGVALIGAHGIVESTAIRDTRPRASDGQGGRGLGVQMAIETGAPASAQVRDTLIDGSHEAGVYVGGADLLLEDVSVLDTKPTSKGTFGDGVLVSLAYWGALLRVPNVTISGTLIEMAARAGVSSFASNVAIGSSRLECNPLDLDGEAFKSEAFVFTDLGGNACGCAAVFHACKVLTTNLSPPGPI